MLEPFSLIVLKFISNVLTMGFKEVLRDKIIRVKLQKILIDSVTELGKIDPLYEAAANILQEMFNNLPLPRDLLKDLVVNPNIENFTMFFKETRFFKESADIEVLTTEKINEIAVVFLRIFEKNISADPQLNDILQSLLVKNTWECV